MKEAFGNSFVFTIVIIFVAISLFILVGSISYSKAAKIKTRILSLVENAAEEKGSTLTSSDFADETRENSLGKNISDDLSKIGYRINTSGANNHKTFEGCTVLNNYSSYRYSVYKCCAERGIYYKVVSYMYFDIPIISDLLEIPITGESKIFYKITPGSDC